MDFSVIFDMDGVIVDSNPFHKKAWKLFCDKHGIFIDDNELETKIYGRTGVDALPILFNRNLSKELIELYSSEVNANYRKLFTPHINPLPGLKELLKELKEKDVKVAIATSAPPVNVEFVLDKTGLSEYFNIIVDDTQVSKGKPDPEIYLTTAKHLKVKPERCIVIEDSIAWIEAATNAGMKVIGITTTHTAEELNHTDLTINNFNELNFTILEKIMS